MADFDPQGQITVILLDTIPVAPLAPKISELTAGIDITDWIVPDGFVGGTNKPAYISSASLKDKVDQQVISLSTIDNLALTGKAAKFTTDPAYDIYTEIINGDTYWLAVDVSRSGVPILGDICHLITATAGPRSMNDKTGKKLATVTIPFGTGLIYDDGVVAASS